jgi:hypothetical protein
VVWEYAEVGRHCSYSDKYKFFATLVVHDEATIESEGAKKV